jgi:hypothetical protein
MTSETRRGDEIDRKYPDSTLETRQRVGEGSADRHNRYVHRVANQTIDADAERIAAMRAEIHSGVWLLLVLVAAFGCITTSYGAGAEGTRSKLGSVFLPVIIAVVIVLIFDISHSRVGLIQISQQPLVDLQQSMTLN